MNFSSLSAPRRQPAFRAGAFSLVEVVMAMGILSFAVVTIMGLLPVGLSSLRQSMNQTVEAQILRSVGGQFVVGKFTQLATNGILFSKEGQPCTSDQAFYTVNVTTNTPQYPGSTNAVALTSSLTTLQVEIIYKPASTSAAAGMTNRYALQVANSGK